MTFDEDRLMRYFDGELDAEETREMDQLLASSPEARALLGDFDRIGAELRAIAEDQGARADGIADRVMGNLGTPERESGGGRVREEAAKLKHLAATGAEQSTGRVIPFPTVAGVVLAAAAAVALFVHAQSPGPVALTPVAESASVAVGPGPGPAASAAPAPTEVAAAAAEGDEPEPGASIESVDFGTQNGTIFMVASGPQVTPVVWLVDESAPSGGRMAPL